MLAIDITPAGTRRSRTQFELPVTFIENGSMISTELYDSETGLPVALLDESKTAEAALKALHLLLPRSVAVAYPLNRETGRVVAFDHYKTAAIGGKRYPAQEIIQAAVEGWLRKNHQFFRKVVFVPPEAELTESPNTAQAMAAVAQATKCDDGLSS